MTEPLNRRGPRPLPLRADEWNQVTIDRTKGTVTLSLNDVVVYERPIDWTGDQRFGLFRHDSTTEVKVRNVVLTGDWPQELPQELLDNPLAIVGEPASVASRHALNRLFQEEFLTENLSAVRRNALALPVAERFEFLSRWILPGMDHPGFRVSGDFTPTRPAPVAFEPGVEEPELGGQIVSPVFDWLDAARELGRLDECRQRVEAVVDIDAAFQRRAKVALLLLIGLEQKQGVANEASWEKLFGLLKDETNAEGENHWPEMLVATRSVGDSPDGKICSELILDLVMHRMLRWKGPDISRWHNQLSASYGKVLRDREPGGTNAPASLTQFHQWIPVAAARARTAGSGYPDLSWYRHDNRVVKVSGHDIDYLYYRLPLGGNYQIECDLVLPNVNPIAILLGGTYAGPVGGYDGLDHGTFRGDVSPIVFQPKLTDIPKPMRYRAVLIQDGIRTVYLNGRKVLTTALPQQLDPWIAIRSPGWHRSTVENVRILGQPMVLNSVPLSRPNDQSGWLDYYDAGGWEHRDTADAGSWIVGHSIPGLAGTFTERLHRYQRPLVEDGSIEYEFFYDPGVVETCPALDRLAFLLQPSGVREHWITDGRIWPRRIASRQRYGHSGKSSRANRIAVTDRQMESTCPGDYRGTTSQHSN